MGQATSSVSAEPERTTLLVDMDRSKVAHCVSSPEKAPALSTAADLAKPIIGEASQSSIGITMRTAAAVASWMALNITIGNLNGWILKQHAFGYPVCSITAACCWS